MNPIMKYTLFRLAIFVVVSAVLWVLPVAVDPLLKLMVALLVSAVVSFFVMKRMRGQVAEQVAGAVQRRTAKKQRLRAALAGDDDEV
jgi:sensor histidine kinase regulating citrate/malate metabolism